MANMFRDGSGDGNFKRWCELPSIHGVIDGIHIATIKPVGAFANDYYYKT
jgi:hypothetical protein